METDDTELLIKSPIQSSFDNNIEDLLKRTFSITRIASIRSTQSLRCCMDYE